jgi:hypothetical protein
MVQQDIVGLVNSLIETHRVRIGIRPKTTPVAWKGIHMTVEEAKMVIEKLQVDKLNCQEWMNNTQTGGEITTLASAGAGMAAMITGAALLLFPPTAIAGVITLASGIGAASIGKMVGDGVSNIGINSNTQDIQQIDSYIDSLKNAIISSI